MKILIFASFLGFLGVVMGAFGAHALKEVLEPEALENYHTGVRYMMIHTLVLLFLNGSNILNPNTQRTLSLLFTTGIVFFSGSIFAISLDVISASNIWFITPLGGLFLISGWLGMVVAFFRKYRQES